MQVVRLKQWHGSTTLNPQSLLPISRRRVTGAQLQTTFEVLDPKIASGLKKIINGDFKRLVFFQEEAAQKENAFSRQVAWMIYQYFKVSDTDDSVLDLNEILKVELKNDNVQSFSTRWDETIIAMKKQPDEEVLHFFLFRPSPSTVTTAEAIAVSVLSRYCSKRESRDQKIREKHFARFWRCTSQGQGKINSGDCVPWTTKGQCSRGDKCGMKHDPEKRR